MGPVCAKAGACRHLFPLTYHLIVSKILMPVPMSTPEAVGLHIVFHHMHSL